MLAARELSHMAGVTDAAVVMATEANKGILKGANLLTAEAQAAGPNDLVIAVSAEAEVLDKALAEAEKLLHKKQASGEAGGVFRPKTLRGAVKAAPEANVAVISVAGRYAADEAMQALQHGLHVLLFSDNVSLEDEIRLKQYAVANGRLLMGPGAGTATLNGVALGFANLVPAGPVGIVSAAGTGLQEVSTLLSKQGVGITQGIGTGGRDLKEAVGGLMMLAGLKALQDDPDTQVILLVSKPPAPAVAVKVLQAVAQSNKPSVVCMLGGDIHYLPNPRHIMASTLEEAAILAARLATEPGLSAETLRSEWNAGIRPPLPGPRLSSAAELRQRLVPGQRYLRGLFSGGTLCYEAQVVWQEPEFRATFANNPVFSNAPLHEANHLPDSNSSLRHTVVDLGEEEFTVGRPHPMIDNDLRIRRLLQEARDPETAVILLDVVLGYGAHPDPAGELGPAIQQARRIAAEAGRELLVVASITGTEEDPQRLSRQTQALQQAGASVCPSNAAAARLTAELVATGKTGRGEAL